MKKATVIIALSGLFLFPVLAFAQPPQLPHLFWGAATISGNSVPAGSIITAIGGGLERGRIVVGPGAIYGGSAMFDPKLMVQGAAAGEELTFVLQPNNLTAAQTATFASGDVTNLDLAFTAPSVGGGGGGGVGGGGGGGGVFAPVTGPAVPQGPVAQGPAVGGVIPPAGGLPAVGGQVLGAATFRFNQNLGQGSRNDDVLELQQRLQAEGVYNGPITGFFGPLTQAALKAYQTKKGILSTGFLGPLTRAELNKSEGPVVQVPSAPISQITSAQRESLIREIQNTIQRLLAEVNRLLAAQRAQVTTPIVPPTPVTPAADNTAPSVSVLAPVSGAVLPSGATLAELRVEAQDANGPVTCRYNEAADVSYEAMSGSLSRIGTNTFSTTISGLASGYSYNYYVRCRDSASPANANDSGILVNFSIQQFTPAGGGGGY